MMLRTLALAVLLAGCKDKQPQQAKPIPAPATKDATVANTPPVDPAATTPKDMPSTEELVQLAKANNNFGLALWGRLGPGNLAMSPASITTALAMTWAGAKGDTAAEMQKVLRFEGDQESVLSKWGRISLALQDQKRPLKLRIANRLFGDKHYEFDTIFFDIIFKTFGARIDVFDFKTEAEDARKKINTWVESYTEQRIKDLLPPNSVNAETRLVLVNAIYFLADWAEPFEKAATRDEDFAISATQKKKVATMHRQGRFSHASSNGASLLELPYKDRSAAMFILLPDKVDGLAALEGSLTDTLKTLQSKLTPQTVAVALPRFTIDPPDATNIGKHLQALGMPLAFDATKADFSGIAKPKGADRVFISGVLHKAFVKVDEKGTEAAAATAIAAPAGRPPPKGIEFRADHPFMFLIVDKSTGVVLFIGRVVDPK